MEEMIFYLALPLAALLLWYAFYYAYKVKSKEFIRTFFDSQNNITILATTEAVVMINKAGLDVFGFETLNSFLVSKPVLLDYFIAEEGCLDKYTYGKKWIEKVEQTKKKSVKVKIFSKEDTLEYYYKIKISKLKGSKEYILTFTDISDIEREKSTLQESAELDPLTKIYNRVKLNEMFQSIFFNANKYNLKLSIILFDIDHFKSINDTYGHNVGDKVLVELSRLSKSLLRSHDIIARWGGEEFMIVLNETSQEEAKVLGDRLRLSIDKYHFEVVEHVTCSFGVTEFSAGDTPAQFLERVDEALYEAKENGRNRVVLKSKA